jgi:tRNA U55 pseudouridine synthase TruB
MPVSREENRRVIQELGERPSVLFFPVSLNPLQSLLTSGTVDANAKWNAITNDATGEILAIHKDKYRLQKNEDVFREFNRALAESPLDLRGLIVEDELAYQGGRAIRTYRMPAHRVDIGEADPVDLMLKIQNSYDGSRRFGMNFGAFRVLCSNGLVIGNNMCEIKAKHTSGLNVNEITRSLSDAIEVFQQSAGQWSQWQETPCPDGVPLSVVNAIPGISDSLKERILGYYQTESQTKGQNLWVLYNSLTRWSTHETVKETAQDNVSAIVLAREEKVRKALRHPVFGIAA